MTIESVYEVPGDQLSNTADPGEMLKLATMECDRHGTVTKKVIRTSGLDDDVAVCGSCLAENAGVLTQDDDVTTEVQ